MGVTAVSSVSQKSRFVRFPVTLTNVDSLFGPSERKRTIFGSHCRVADDLHSYRARATDAAESVFVGSLRSCSEFTDLIIHDVRAPGETGQSGKHTRYLRLNKGLGGF